MNVSFTCNLEELFLQKDLTRERNSTYNCRNDFNLID